MTKRNWKNFGVVLFALLIIACAWVWLWYSNSRQVVVSSQVVAECKEMEELLRAKDKQVEFYFNKVNELIREINQAEAKNNPIIGGDQMELQDQLVWDSLDTEEFKKILGEYRPLYGVITEYDIPKTETLGGLRYKVKESIAVGYDLLPKYYGWTNVLMSLSTKEFEEVDALYKEHFGGDGIPTLDIYGTMEELIDIVNKSVKEGINLLPEYYHYGNYSEDRNE